MGFGDRRREKHELAAAEAVDAAHEQWGARVAVVRDRLEAVRTWFGSGTDDSETAQLMIRDGEKVYAVLEGAALIEPRRAPGHFVGGSQGVSIHVARRVNYRVGAMRGTYVPGPESPTPIDTGRAVVTDQRVTFAGLKASREWLYAKLIGYQHDPANWTVLQVSNRQKASGIGYDLEHADDIRFRLDLAIATFSHRRESMGHHLDEELTALLAQEPPRPATPDDDSLVTTRQEPTQLPGSPPVLPPAGWYPDATDVTLQRYWDGGAWTSHTAPR
jgi:hypothetical protein